MNKIIAAKARQQTLGHMKLAHRRIAKLRTFGTTSTQAGLDQYFTDLYGLTTNQWLAKVCRSTYRTAKRNIAVEMQV